MEIYINEGLYKWRIHWTRKKINVKRVIKLINLTGIIKTNGKSANTC